MRSRKRVLVGFLCLALVLGLLAVPLMLYRLFPPGPTPLERHMEEMELREHELRKREGNVMNAIGEQIRRGGPVDTRLFEEQRRVQLETGDLEKEKVTAAREAARERETWQFRLRRAIGW